MEKQDAENLLQIAKSGLRACSMPGGNSTEYPFALSIHGAWMLQKGIANYARDALDRSWDATECYVRIETALTEATKLRNWFLEVDPDYLSFNIGMLDSLLRELETERERIETQG